MKTRQNTNQNASSSCLHVVPIFQHLTEEELKQVQKISKSKKFSKGSHVYQAGNETDKLFVVNSGQIKISRISEKGDEQVIRVLGPGDFLGELSLFSNLPMNDYAEATENTVVCMVEGSGLKNIMKDNPTIAFKILEELSKRLENVDKRVEEIRHQSTKWRLAQMLLNLSKGEKTIRLPISKGMLASQMGMNNATLSRNLTYFEELGLISQNGQREITIHNHDGLREIE
ncbi:MAG TPA: Crp/Fnr family transcriptional regulator [Acholeplasmataceae bacterium]|jgi:CRP/FNR family transcriptional regulator|nr:Crp/Fnr family transcriptional regulator [Acholeplasmataceae bacterium]